MSKRPKPRPPRIEQTFMRKPGQILDELSADVNAALKLLNPDTAEQIVGSDPPEEYGVLLRGIRGVHGLTLGMMRKFGLQVDSDTLEVSAKLQAMLFQIVNYAYALGLRRGREGN